MVFRPQSRMRQSCEIGLRDTTSPALQVNFNLQLKLPTLAIGALLSRILCVCVCGVWETEIASWYKHFLLSSEPIHNLSVTPDYFWRVYRARSGCLTRPAFKTDVFNSVCIAFNGSLKVSSRDLGDKNGKMCVVMSKGTSYSQQIYQVVYGQFPATWIQQQHAERFLVTSLTTSDNQWVVVMSQGARINANRQFLALDMHYPAEVVRQYWAKGNAGTLLFR